MNACCGSRHYSNRGRLRSSVSLCREQKCTGESRVSTRTLLWRPLYGASERDPLQALDVYQVPPTDELIETDNWGVSKRSNHTVALSISARLEEPCTLIRSLWTDPALSFDGQYYQTQEAYCEPKPLQQSYPPIIVGASGEQLMLRVVAKNADRWSAMAATPEEFRRKSAILDRYCAERGRDPATIGRSISLSSARPPSHVHKHRRSAQRANRPEHQLKRKKWERLSKQIEGRIYTK